MIRILLMAIFCLSCAENQELLNDQGLSPDDVHVSAGDQLIEPMDPAHDVGWPDVFAARADQGWMVDGDGSDAGPMVRPVENPYLPRIDNSTCQLPEPPPVGAYESQQAFPNLRFQRPIWIGHAPGDDGRMYVVEQAGRIYRFQHRDDVENAQVFLDLTVSRAGNEEGLLGLAFHPEYASNGRFFVYYSAGRTQCESRRCSIISEFRRGDDGLAAMDSERILMRVPQPYGNHNGGDLHFGPDGYLYISIGDGGSAGDPMNHAQNTSNLLGTIVRIDVDVGDTPYGIPADNPFAASEDGRPEIWAWGLRNVWRMSFDTSTGILWSGDVGQDAHEEVNRMTSSGNYGWRIREGLACYRAQTCRSEDLISPVHTYDHPIGESITGGVVYRGTRLRELWGQYLFADYQSGRIWAMDSDGGGLRESRLIGRQPRVTSFGVDADGAVYLTTFQSDVPVVRLVRQASVMARPLPQYLSQTGCFSDTALHAVAPGVLNYQVNHPFWSDGLAKARFIAFPEGGHAVLNDKNQHVLPVGTHVLKTFFDTDGRRRVETRIWARFESGWQGFTWRWNAAQTDAELVHDSQNVDVRVQGQNQRWTLPSRSQCDQCHTEAAGYVLGWHPHQLNGVFIRGDIQVDQLNALVEAGYVPPASLTIDPLPARDEADASLADRARAVLAVNCASCHQPGGFANAQLDLRFQTALGETGMCARPAQGDFQVPDAKIVMPGRPESSVLYLRMNRRDEGAMPPIGSHRVDDEATQVVGDWIRSLNACP